MPADIASPTIAVLGLGEAGGHIAADLVAAGAVVRGFDPKVAAGPGIQPCANDADAVRSADIVVSLTCANNAMDALGQAIGALGEVTVYADLNTASPAFKRNIADLAASKGIRFADVALMSPVPGHGLRTPMLASGPAADAFAGVLRGLGATVEVLPGPPGVAAERKLLRSVFYKGLAAAVVESLHAARAAGCEEWIRRNIEYELDTATAATVDRLEQGSVQHAVRRVEEMAAAAEMLDGLGIEPRVARASEGWLRSLAEGNPARTSTR